MMSLFTVEPARRPLGDRLLTTSLEVLWQDEHSFLRRW
jgi:hypothetical protein